MESKPAPSKNRRVRHPVGLYCTRRVLVEEIRKKRGKGFYTEGHRDTEVTEKMKSKKEKVCTGLELAKALAKASLSEDEAEAWRRDLRAARKRLKAMEDKWRGKR
jgi:hypothetical protein